MFCKLYIFISILFCNNSFVSGYTLTEETSLHNTLTTGYLSSLRPGSDRSQPVHVNVSFFLRSIKEFEETSGKFSIIGDFEFAWVDERMAWTPSSNGYINTTTFRQKQVWIPDLICINPFGQTQGLSIDQVIVQYDYTGQASWMPGNLFEISCDADVSYYPYDSQKCILTFMTSGYKSSDVYLNPTNDSSMLKYFRESGLWILRDTRMFTESRNSAFQSLNLEFTLKRRSTFYLVNLLLPMCSLGILHVFIFRIPVESGERLGYSVTVLLALFVYMSIVSERLPESSEPHLSILSYKLLGDIMLGSIMSVLTILGLRYHHADESTPVSKFLQLITNCFICTPCKRSSSSVSEIDIVTKTDDTMKWSLVAQAFDSFCCMFAIVMNVILNMVFIITVSKAP